MRCIYSLPPLPPPFSGLFIAVEFIFFEMRPSFIILPTLAGFSIAADCAADNCLRALRATQTPGQLQAAQSFCATYTTQLVQATAIPSFAVDACKQNQNGNLAERLSSACACLPAATTTSAGNGTATPTPTGGACALVSASSAAQRAATPSGKCKTPWARRKKRERAIRLINVEFSNPNRCRKPSTRVLEQCAAWKGSCIEIGRCHGSIPRMAKW